MLLQSTNLAPVMELGVLLSKLTLKPSELEILKSFILVEHVLDILKYKDLLTRKISILNFERMHFLSDDYMQSALKYWISKFIEDRTKIEGAKQILDKMEMDNLESQILISKGNIVALSDVHDTIERKIETIGKRQLQLTFTLEEFKNFPIKYIDDKVVIELYTNNLVSPIEIEEISQVDTKFEQMDPPIVEAIHSDIIPVDTPVDLTIREHTQLVTTFSDSEEGKTKNMDESQFYIAEADALVLNSEEVEEIKETSTKDDEEFFRWVFANEQENTLLSNHPSDDSTSTPIGPKSLDPINNTLSRKERRKLWYSSYRLDMKYHSKLKTLTLQKQKIKKLLCVIRSVTKDDFGFMPTSKFKQKLKFNKTKTNFKNNKKKRKNISKRNLYSNKNYKRKTFPLQRRSHYVIKNIIL